MPVYRGTTPLKAYKGDMQPVNIYRGSTKVAGWHAASYSGTSPLTVDCDYDVPPDALVITGKCVQTGTPDPSSPAPISTITGDMTITGADGDASDTATVALGGNVCSSLPDGTHDSYDAVTGVLTKRIGKYVGASGTSWTISGAASGSPILSDCFGSDVLDGTSYSAYDATSKPNLTPFFSRSLSDATYWRGIDTEHITQLTDGWVHVEYDNSAGTSMKYPSIRVVTQSCVACGKTYTLLVEIKNSDTSNAAECGINIIAPEGSATQLFADGGDHGPGTLVDGTYQITFPALVADAYPGGLNNGYVFVDKGSKVDFDLRLSLYEGDYNGAYKPYALPCTPTIYYALATPTTVQLTPHLPVVRTGIKTLTVGADVVPMMSATVKSMESAITSITQG